MKFSIDDTEYGREGYGKAVSDYTMAEFIDRMLASTDENPAPYFRRKHLYSMFPSLKEDIQPLPEYLQPNWLSETYLVNRVSKVLNPAAEIYLYVGGMGGTFPVLHYDGAATHAFLFQIYGRKEYILYDQGQEPYLYPSPTKINLSLVNSVEKPDLEKFPLFAKAKPTIGVLEAGELLFVPCRWWHTAKMLSPSITISTNVLNCSNWPELITFVAKGKRTRSALAATLYLKGAGAWRSWRDRAWSKRGLRAALKPAAALRNRHQHRN